MDRQNSNSDVNRRTMLLVAAGAAPLLVLSAGASAQAKMPPSAVAYQDQPQGAQRCDGCNLFVAPDACQLVSGKISPNGWCRLWVKKA